MIIDLVITAVIILVLVIMYWFIKENLHQIALQQEEKFTELQKENKQLLEEINDLKQELAARTE